MLDYHCADCGTTAEELQPRKDVPSEIPCECGGVAARCLSAVRYKPQYGVVATGESQERPPWVKDTTPECYK